MFLLIFITFLFPLFGVFICYSYLTYSTLKLRSIVVPYKELIIIFSISMASFGYGLAPIAETDLTRYFDMVLAYDNVSFLEVLKNDAEHLYTRDLLFYFVCRTEDVHLLPFLVGINIYSICGYIIYDQIKKTNHIVTSEELIIILTISFAVITPYSLMGNVRCVQAYIIISFGAYREFIQKKRNIINYLLYLIAVGLHSTAIILVAIRYLYLFFKKFKYIVIFLPFVIPFIIDFAYQYIDYYPTVIKAAVWSAHHYLHWTEGGWTTEVEKSISNKVIRMFGSYYLMIVLLLLFIYKKIEKKSLLDNSMIAYLFSITIMALASLTIKAGGFWRFEAVVVLFSSIYIFPILDCGNKKLKIIVYILFISCLLMGGANIIFVMRNIIPLDTFGDMLLLNGFHIVHSIIKGLLYF